MVNQDRNVFAACMVAAGDVDAMVTGLTRNYHVALDEITRVLDPEPDSRVFGLSLVLGQDKTLFVSDTAVTELPNSEQLADIAQQTAAVARQMGHEPRVALISFSNFGNPALPRSELVSNAVKILGQRQADFEYDGEMTVDVALNAEVMKNYPFCRLSEPANILVVPARHSASISVKLMQEMGGATVIGPILTGIDKQVKICSTTSTVNDILNMAIMAACKVG